MGFLMMTTFKRDLLTAATPVLRMVMLRLQVLSSRKVMMVPVVTATVRRTSSLLLYLPVSRSMVIGLW